MGRAINDLSGKVFGRLTVKGICETRSADGRAMWKCKCSCGKEKVIAGSELVRTKSCGCLAREVARNIALSKSLGETERILSRKIASYKNAAKKRELPFELEKSELVELFSGACQYCGQISVIDDKSRINGIDRLDPASGYRKGNVVSCCRVCNQIKWEQTFEEFVVWIRALYERKSEWLRSAP